MRRVALRVGARVLHPVLRAEPAPLLYNIGAAADRLRCDRQALESYQRYLELVPEASNAESVRERIAFLEDAVASATATEETATAAAPTDEVDASSGGGSIAEEWWLWTLIGVAVVAAVAIPIAVVLTQDPGTEPLLRGDLSEDQSGVVLTLRGTF